MKSRVLILGGRNKARALANSLIKRDYKVTVINDCHDTCLMLADIDKLEVIYGDGTKCHVLEEACATNYDIAIAMTSKDEDNLMFCQLCKKRFNIRKTVSIIADPHKKEFFQKVNVDRVVCATDAIASIIEQQSFINDMANIIPIGEGRIQIAEIPITNNSPVIDKKIWEIDLPRDVILSCILRGSKTIIPRGDTRILLSDMVVVISGNGQEENAIKALMGE